MRVGSNLPYVAERTTTVEAMVLQFNVPLERLRYHPGDQVAPEKGNVAVYSATRSDEQLWVPVGSLLEELPPHSNCSYCPEAMVRPATVLLRNTFDFLDPSSGQKQRWCVHTSGNNTSCVYNTSHLFEVFGPEMQRESIWFHCSLFGPLASVSKIFPLGNPEFDEVTQRDLDKRFQDLSATFCNPTNSLGSAVIELQQWHNSVPTWRTIRAFQMLFNPLPEVLRKAVTPVA